MNALIGTYGSNRLYVDNFMNEIVKFMVDNSV